jgi:hypothetical protein
MMVDILIRPLDGKVLQAFSTFEKLKHPWTKLEVAAGRFIVIRKEMTGAEFKNFQEGHYKYKLGTASAKISGTLTADKVAVLATDMYGVGTFELLPETEWIDTTSIEKRDAAKVLEK